MDKITSRAVIGELHRALSADNGAGWINLVSNFFPSDQAIETYAWLGQSPVMREWLGQRQAKGLSENDIQIANKEFEATLEVLVKDLRRDKFSMIKARIQDLARRGNSHWARLLSTLIIAGESTPCYDGSFFFDKSHEEGKSGKQSNDISVALATLPVSVHGSVAAPSVAEVQLAIIKGVQQILTFKDDEGEPMNEDASSFIVMAPPVYMQQALQAVATPQQVDESQSALSELKSDFSIHSTVNARLSSWEDKFVVYRTDSPIKSFIRQQETVIQIKAKAEGSEYEFDNNAHQYGINTSRNVGYGYWQNSCLVTLT